MDTDKHDDLMQSLSLLWLSCIAIGAAIIWWVRRWDMRRRRKVVKTRTYSQRLAERLSAPKGPKRNQQRGDRQ